jgi:hypothetical protein
MMIKHKAGSIFVKGKQGKEAKVENSFECYFSLYSLYTR